MKRVFAGLIALILLVTALPVLAEETEKTETVLTVGNPTPMRGQFFMDLWGNATSDSDVRDLLHAYNLIHWDPDHGMFTVDPSVVSGVVGMESPEGDHTYIMVLYDDLYYSDGTKVTAWDYAFSYLLSIAPELGEIGASPLIRQQIAGYDEYIENGGPLTGVKVLAEDTISVTLDHEYLPFFYEMGLLSCIPYPVSVIAPGVTVRDNGRGVYLANIDETIEEPLFSKELLEATILDPETGFRSHPSVVTGPYTLTSFDGETAEFALNPYYKGNSRGERPSIDRLIYKAANVDTMIEQLKNGEFDLLNKVTRLDKVLEGIELVGKGMDMDNYPRMGLSYINFSCERPTVSDAAVRQAIAYCFDRNQTTRDYTGSFGIRTDGYYGIGQWMYGIIAGTVPFPAVKPEDENDTEAMAKYEKELAAFEALNLNGLNAYELNTDEAARILTEAGWNLNEDGLREKDGVVLDLRMIYPEGNNVHESLQVNLADHLAKVGIRLTMEPVPMAELLNRVYLQTERTEDMIYLASNFNIVFDPSINFAPNGNWAYTNLQDEELYNATLAMRRTHPGDVLTYMQHWVEFEERFNELLPMIPVYSNVYFDFFRDELKNYHIAENVTWSQAIVSSYWSETDAETEAAAGTEAPAETEAPAGTQEMPAETEAPAETETSAEGESEGKKE